MPRILPRLFAIRLSRRPASRRDRRRHARGAVLAGLLAIVFVNVALGVAAELYPRIRDPFYGDKLAKLRTRLKASPNVPSVVMLGSSRTGFAFNGQRVEACANEAKQPVVAFNFGIPASGPVTQLLYTRRFIRDGVKPDLLVLEILPSMFVDDAAGPLERLFLHGDRLTRDELATVSALKFPEAEVRRRWREARLTPWYGLRFQLLGRVVQSWIPWQLRYDWSRGADAWGWGTPVWETLTDDQRVTALESARGEYADILHGWQPGRPTTDALRQVLAECAAHGVSVKLVLMPESMAFREFYPPPVRERLAAFTRGLANEFHCELVDAREWLADELFTDGHHQLRSGAAVFSDRMARDVILPWRKERE